MATQQRSTNFTLGRGLAALTVLMLFAAGGVGGAETAKPASILPLPITQPAVPGAHPSLIPQAQQSAESHTLHLLVGRSLVISSPTPIKRVSVADPNIVEAVVITPYQVLLNGKVPGGVSLLIWDETDQSQTFEVSVDIDILSLNEKIHEVFPTEPVQIETSKDMVMISGKISSALVAEKILEIVKNSTPKVTSMMQFPTVPVKEILLEVKFAEVDRSALTQLGANILHNFGTNMPISTTTQEFSPPGFQQGTPAAAGTPATPNQFSISNLMNVSIFRPDINMAVLIEALQTQNILQILAEPNLMTESGKQASFLAGGEFPFPVLQGAVGAGVAGITIQFREYGVRLSFTPTLTADGLIHLNVKPEVSSLDYSNALSISGFTVPALSTRRAESDMELRDGQSFAIAGLIDNRVTEQMNKIPGISSIPILGKLFESRSLNKSNDELMILVTPRIVQPLDPANVPAGPLMPRNFLAPLTPDKVDPAPAAKTK